MMTKLFFMREPLESIHFYVKVSKTGEKMDEVTVGLKEGPTLPVRYLIKAKYNFSEHSLAIHQYTVNFYKISKNITLHLCYAPYPWAKM
jgi:hypothetical protein